MADFTGTTRPPWQSSNSFASSASAGSTDFLPAGMEKPIMAFPAFVKTMAPTNSHGKPLPPTPQPQRRSSSLYSKESAMIAALDCDLSVNETVALFAHSISHLPDYPRETPPLLEAKAYSPHSSGKHDERSSARRRPMDLLQRQHSSSMRSLTDFRSINRSPHSESTGSVTIANLPPPEAYLDGQFSPTFSIFRNAKDHFQDGNDTAAMWNVSEQDHCTDGRIIEATSHTTHSQQPSHGEVALPLGLDDHNTRREPAQHHQGQKRWSPSHIGRSKQAVTLTASRQKPYSPSTDQSKQTSPILIPPHPNTIQRRSEDRQTIKTPYDTPSNQGYITPDTLLTDAVTRTEMRLVPPPLFFNRSTRKLGENSKGTAEQNPAEDSDCNTQARDKAKLPTRNFSLRHRRTDSSSRDRIVDSRPILNDHDEPTPEKPTSPHLTQSASPLKSPSKPFFRSRSLRSPPLPRVDSLRSPPGTEILRSDLSRTVSESSDGSRSSSTVAESSARSLGKKLFIHGTESLLSRKDKCGALNHAEYKIEGLSTNKNLKKGVSGRGIRAPAALKGAEGSRKSSATEPRSYQPGEPLVRFSSGPREPADIEPVPALEHCGNSNAVRQLTPSSIAEDDRPRHAIPTMADSQQRPNVSREQQKSSSIAVRPATRSNSPNLPGVMRLKWNGNEKRNKHREEVQRRSRSLEKRVLAIDSSSRSR